MSIFKTLLLEASLLSEDVFFKEILNIVDENDDTLNLFKKAIKENEKSKDIYKNFSATSGVNIKKLSQYYKVILEEMKSIDRQEDFKSVLLNLINFHEKISKKLSEDERDNILDGVFSYLDICKRLYLEMDKISLEDNYLVKNKDTWEKVAENKLWVAIYPKTQQSFIEWSTSMPNCVKESYKGNPDARVAWCTSRREANNLWENYATSAACFILIKKEPHKIISNEKINKICLDMIKKGYSEEEVDIKRKELTLETERYKEENKFLNVYGYNKKDKNRRISFKVDIEKYDIQLSSNDTSDYDENDPKQKVMYDFGKKGWDTDDNLSNTVNADNSLMSMSNLKSVVDDEIIQSCINYTKENFSSVDETPVELFFRKQKLKDIKEMLVITSNFAINKNPVTEPENQVYFSDISDSLSRFFYNSEDGDPYENFDNILNDKVLNKTVDITSCISYLFFFGARDNSKEGMLIIDLLNYFLKNDYPLVGQKIHRDILISDRLKHKLITFDAMSTFHRLDIDITSKFFTYKRKVLFELFKNAKNIDIKRKFNNIICSDMIFYKDSDFSREELSDELEYGEFIKYYKDEDEQMFSDYIDWLIKKINRFSDSFQIFKETIEDVLEQVKDVFGDESIELDVFFERIDNFLKTKDFTKESFFIDKIDIDEICYSQSYIEKLIKDSNFVLGDKKKYNDINKKDFKKIVDSFFDKVMSGLILDIDISIFFDIVDVVVNFNDAESVKKIVDCCMKKRFVLNFFKLGYRNNTISGFKDLIIKNTNYIINGNDFIAEIDDEKSHTKDYVKILDKMKARDKEYSELLTRAEQGDLDLNSYIRFLSLL